MNKRENPRKSNAGRASDSNKRSNSPSSYGKSYGNKPERKSSYGNERSGNEGSSTGGFRKDNERGGRPSGGGKRISFQERDKRSDSRGDDKRAGGFGNSRPDTRGEGRSSSGSSFGGRENRPYDGDKRSDSRRDDKRAGGFGNSRPDTRSEGRPSSGGSFSSRENRPYDGDKRPARTFGDRPNPRRDDNRSEGFRKSDDNRGGERSYGGGSGFGKRDGDSRPAGDERRSGSRPYSGGFGKRETDDRSSNRSRPSGDNRSYGGGFEKRDGERSGGERSNYSGERRSSDSRSGERGSSFNRRDNDDRRESRSDSKPTYGTKRSYGKPDNKPGKRSSFGGFAGKGRAVPPDYDSRDIKKHSDTDIIRLNKYISNAGICSRREADKHIAHGMISVNGKVVTELGYKVQRGDSVKMGSKLLKPEPNVYVLLNKPKDFITTTEDPQERKTVMTLVANACQERIYPVGRLDRNTTGLLLFTNDGELAEKLAHPSNSMKKIYQVTLERPLSKDDFEKIAKGLRLEDGVANVDDLAFVSDDKTVVGIEIHSGRNRIVRRIFEHVGYKVMYLDRVMYAGLTKKDLPRGTWRYLDEKEVVQLKHMKN